ncbi:hypothetical protein CEXT_581911 [Caerostris extrusa]|uniref:Secreted protein n=1 Tax=Caerostris extrusa TaxID=172846 RepID=A0AAV4R730_CAEEX|nr:hypothetical protein CEXT_581911 [Caerostris extrusa]
MYLARRVFVLLMGATDGRSLFKGVHQLGWMRASDRGVSPPSRKLNSVFGRSPNRRAFLSGERLNEWLSRTDSQILLARFFFSSPLSFLPLLLLPPYFCSVDDHDHFH